MSTIIDGSFIAREQLGLLFPSLADKQLHIVQFQSDVVIDRFVRAKVRIAQEIGVIVLVHRFENIKNTTDAIVRLKNFYMENPHGGIIVQLPFPEQFDVCEILNTIPVHRDVDVLNQETYRQWQQGQIEYVPPVARAVWWALESLGNVFVSDLSNKKIAVVGHGLLVGKPVSDFLHKRGLSVEIVTLETTPDQRSEILHSADVIISGTGDPWSIHPTDVTPGCVLIDCGTASESGVLRGDIHPDCYHLCRAYTPVPGGIGPMTVAGVFVNCATIPSV